MNRITAALALAVVLSIGVIAQQKDNGGNSVPPVEINKRPLMDLAGMLNDQIEHHNIDLTQNFTIRLYAVITDEGTFDTMKSKFDTQKDTGDPNMVLAAKQALQAVGSSGFFQYFKLIHVDKAIIDVWQDDNQLAARLSAPMATRDQAMTAAAATNATALMGKTRAPSAAERTLLTALNATVGEKNTFIINIPLPKQTAQDLIKTALQGAKPKTPPAPAQ